MKIKNISVINLPPIKKLELQNLGNIVIIAGANGSGKSTLKQAIVDNFANPQASTIDLTLESTRIIGEADRWQNQEIELKRGSQNPQFTEYMNSRTRGGRYKGNVVQIDSQRNITPVNYQPITLSTPDPDDEEIDTRYFLSLFSNRWQDVVNRIFQKSANRDSKIIRYVKENPAVAITGNELLDKFPDPFSPYQELFEKLLPGKILDPIDPKNLHDFTYTIEGSSLPFTSLSSGEQEVVKITFDLLSKKMTHCVFLIDEPELHLHPTLTFRLIETLKEMAGGTNQFFFFTHSADLISTYYATGNVYFIEANKSGENEAIKLNDLENNHSTLSQIMGENLGLFAVGKKIVFVEGENSSIDKLTYHSIAQKYFPEAYISPIGSVNDMSTLSRLSGEIQNRLFGIDFYMVRDRDGLTAQNILEIESNSKTKCLKRRMLENYFLDADILAKIALRFCLTDSSLQDIAFINNKLKEMATSFLKHNVQLSIKEYTSLLAGLEVPSISNVQTKELTDIEKEFNAALETALQTRAQLLSTQNISQKFADESVRLTQALESDNWMVEFSGKEIFSVYCAFMRVPPEQVRQAYIEIALSEKPAVFQDIIDIFESFKTQN